MSDLDLLLINPGGREQIYQALGEELTAVEPPCGAASSPTTRVFTAIR